MGSLFMQNHKEWLYVAKEDFDMAMLSLNSSEPIIRPILYHAQQCAEKALKAFLVAKGMLPPRTHDLVSLVNDCMSFDNDFSSIKFAAEELNPYVVDARYPDDAFYIPDISLAEDAVKKAQAIFNFVDEKI